MKIVSRIVAWLLLVAAMPAPLYAQAARAELTGQVTGADGAALPGANVTVRALRTNDSRVVVSGDNGFYTLPALPPGGYAVTVELAGFKRFVQNTVTLATGERVRLDVSLTVGGLEETVNVTGEASTLRTESGSLGQVVPNAAIVGLPLNGRSFISLITLAPGVASPPGSAFPRINGGRPRVNEYLRSLRTGPAALGPPRVPSAVSSGPEFPSGKGTCAASETHVRLGKWAGGIGVPKFGRGRSDETEAGRARRRGVYRHRRRCELLCGASVVGRRAKV